MQRYTSVERLLLLRNVVYGGAATCMVVLVALTQVGAKEIGLKTSVICAAVTLPIWLLLGGTYEFYIFLGKQSYSHLRSKFAINFFGPLLLLAALGSFGMTAGIIWFLMPLAAWLFAGTSLVAAALGIFFHKALARWWYSTYPTGAEDV